VADGSFARCVADGPLSADLIQAFLERGQTDTAVFELFVHRLPPQRSFLMAAGLDQVLALLESLRWLGPYPCYYGYYPAPAYPPAPYYGSYAHYGNGGWRVDHRKRVAGKVWASTA
jgi:hypothetical protein